MKTLSIIFLILGNFVYAQIHYFDLTTTLSLKLYSDNLKAQQEKTIERQKKLQQAQAWVGNQMVIANNIQNEILKGLNEVSETLQNGLQVKEIWTQLNKCYTYAAEISEIASSHPEYAIFGIKASKKTYEQSIRIATDVSDILASGDLNLATSGDRYRLLHNISENVKSLKLWLLAVKMRIEKAKRIGFWQSLNPFSGYINTDKQIVESIMDRYKHNF